ncbi:FAD-dependent oxidoreductase [Acidovorax sp. SUPP2522]|uniref:NAD(P)/FAD-dependent oxidoreductase n=2 Tax=unclassified Acidovorax TaxID=2684926 RepID=UPI0024E1816A|nr:FAD-dependent oxidoreductase [Acidovorax sp. SUPP2522]
MERGSDVLIVGGGIQGMSAALQLARRGIGVCVLEKDYVGRHASGVNAGGVRTLGRHLSELPLSIKAKSLWLTAQDWLDDDCGFRPVGQIRVAETQAAFAQLQTRSSLVSSLGLEYREHVIDASELYDRLPALTPHCVGGLFVADDGYANPYRTVLAMKHAAVRAGAVVEERSAVAHLGYKDGGWSAKLQDGRTFRADVLLNCAGAWGQRIAAMLGDEVALKPNGSMLMITARLPPMVGPVVGAAGRSLSFKQFPNGTVLIGGGHRAPVDLDTNQANVLLPGIAKAAETAITLFPFMASAHAVRFWSGIEGFMDDGLPVIGPSLGSPKAFHAFGFSAHGFQLAPAVGEVMADLVSQVEPATPIEAFSVGRQPRSPSA